VSALDSQASLLLRCRTGASGLRVCWLGNDALWNLGLLIHVTIPVIGHSCLMRCCYDLTFAIRRCRIRYLPLLKEREFHSWL
jgi:hypothetical protein